MKLHLPPSLRHALCATMCLLAAGATQAADTPAQVWDTQSVVVDGQTTTRAQHWGNTLYIGDSISHGFKVNPYRWYLFKNLVDNGLAQTEVGIQTGYYQATAPTTYGTTTFDNLHACQSGITANQVAGQGRTDYFGGTDLQDWLSGTGNYSVHTADNPDTTVVPDTAFVMLGTNDIFGKNSQGAILNTTTMVELADGSTVTPLQWHTDNMKAYLSSIVNSLQTAAAQSGSSVNIVITAVPTWSETRRANSNGTADSNAALTTLNQELKTWAESQQGVTFIDINKGIINVAVTEEATAPAGMSNRPGAAVASMYQSDGQHPNEQGNLIIAGNIAQQLGYAGRTAGQARKDFTDEVFTHQAQDIISAKTTASSGVTLSGEALELSNGATLSAAWDAADNLEKGFSVDFSFGGDTKVGNGATDGWDITQVFSLSVGDGTYSGTLNINEAHIKWGDTILYSTDTSALSDSLRVAYIHGNESQGLSSGFYVWMGDMLIGEALSSSGNTSGLSLTNGSGSSLTLNHLSMAAGAWAPTSTGYTNEDNSLLIEPDSTITYTPTTLENPTWGNGSDTSSNNPAAALANQGIAQLIAGGTNISGGGNVSISVNGGTLSEESFAACRGGWTGHVLVELGGTVTRTATGSCNAAQHSGTLQGNITLVVKEDFKTVGTQTTWSPFVGVNAATVNGDVTMVFSADDLRVCQNAETPFALAGAIGNYRVMGAVDITINAGSFEGNIYGGSANAGRNDWFALGTRVTLNGGSVKGNVYGFGLNGSTQSGGSSVTVTGHATVQSATDGGQALITAGGTKGSIVGGTHLRLKDVTEQSKFAAFLSHSGNVLSGNEGCAVTGQRALVLDNVQQSSIKATLRNFDSVSVTNGTDAGLSSLGGAGTVSVDEGSRLTLLGGEHTAIVSNSGTVAVQTGAILTINGEGQDGNFYGTYEVNGGSLTLTGYEVLQNRFSITSGSLSKTSTRLDGKVSIDARGDIILSGVNASEISSLETHIGASVSGLADTLVLDGATLELDADSQSEAGATLVFNEGGKLSVNKLTLNLSKDFCETLIATLERSRRGITFSGEEYPLRLLVSKGELEADEITINMAEGYEGYTITATGIEPAEGGYSYVTFNISQNNNIPEPGTATLSLLALLGLASRRRR